MLGPVTVAIWKMCVQQKNMAGTQVMIVPMARRVGRHWGRSRRLKGVRTEEVEVVAWQRRWSLRGGRDCWT
jgi:hypothetical protein